MALNNKIEISSFASGLITDIEAAKLPKNAASRLENADIRNGNLETLPGILETDTGLPSGFIKLSQEQFLFTSPSEMQVTLCHGTLSGAHKLYIRPYLSLAGAWVDSWQELTERETGLTADVGTNTTTIVDAGLSSSTDDYYKGWIVYNFTRLLSAIVTGYNGTTKTLTLSWAITSQTSGDTYFVCRNPIYKFVTGASIFSPSANGCRFLQRENAIDIVTGSDLIYEASTATQNKTDLHLSVQNGYAAFNDTDLNFTGFHLTRKPPASMQLTGTSALSAVAIAAGEQALPVPTSTAYLFLPVAVYDGFQEGALYDGNSPFDGTRYGTGTWQLLTGLAVNQKLRAALSIDYDSSAGHLLAPVKNGSDLSDFIIWDRRITHIRFYMAEATQVNGVNYEPSSEWRFVKELRVNSADWAGSGPAYTQTIDITGAEWNAASGVDISDRQGHSSLKVFANANFIATAKKRVAVANVFTEEQHQSIVVFSAINSDSVNTPDVIPHTSFADLSAYGITKILGFVEALGYYVALGENQLVKIDASTLTVDKNIQARGASSSNAIVNANGLIYFVNLEDIYYYHSAQDVIRSIATGFIRDAWRALSTANKQAAAIGYDKRYEKLVIAAGSTIYTYNLPAAYASDLASDTQAVGSWEVYSVGKTFTRFYTDLSGKCIGVANDGKSYELFSSGVANTLVYEKVLGEGNLNLHTLRLTYEASATVTAKVFDMARNAIYPIKTYTFPAQSLHKRHDQHKGCQVKKPKLQISAPMGMKISQIVVNPQPLADEK